MSNPRRFDNVVLYRATEGTTLDKAKKQASKIRELGVQARVDMYKGKYAVWTEKRQAFTKEKMVTLYHGTSSDTLDKIRKSGYVLGFWTASKSQATAFAICYCDGSSYATIHPVILKAIVPDSFITDTDEEMTQVCGFTPENTAYWRKWNKRRGTSDILNKSYIRGVYHFKLKKPNGINLDFNEYLKMTPKLKFREKDWTLRGLPK